MTGRTSRPAAVQTLHHALEARRHIQNVEVPPNDRGRCHWLKSWPALCCSIARLLGRLRAYSILCTIASESFRRCVGKRMHLPAVIHEVVARGVPRDRVPHCRNLHGFRLLLRTGSFCLILVERKLSTASTSVSPAILLKQLKSLSSPSLQSSKTCRFRLCTVLNPPAHHYVACLGSPVFLVPIATIPSLTITNDTVYPGGKQYRRQTIQVV